MIIHYIYYVDPLIFAKYCVRDYLNYFAEYSQQAQFTCYLCDRYYPYPYFIAKRIWLSK